MVIISIWIIRLPLPQLARRIAFACPRGTKPSGWLQQKFGPRCLRIWRPLVHRFSISMHRRLCLIISDERSGTISGLPRIPTICPCTIFLLCTAIFIRPILTLAVAGVVRSFHVPPLEYTIQVHNAAEICARSPPPTQSSMSGSMQLVFI